jgi:hypothetical protein
VALAPLDHGWQHRFEGVHDSVEVEPHDAANLDRIERNRGGLPATTRVRNSEIHGPKNSHTRTHRSRDRGAIQNVRRRDNRQSALSAHQGRYGL